MSSSEHAEMTSSADQPEKSDARPAAPLAAAVFPSMAGDRAWDQPGPLDLLDLANAAVRRLETVAWIIGESKGVGGVGAPQMRVAGIAEILEDIAAALRVVVGEMERRQEHEG